MITYEQAVECCTWRSQLVSDKFGQKIVYRLPSPTEWKEIAEDIIVHDLKRNEKDLKQIIKRFEKHPSDYFLIDQIENNSIAYDLFDNVTEMTSEKGVAMGSNNFELTEIRVNLSRIIKYEIPNPYLGFRCVAEFK